MTIKYLNQWDPESRIAFGLGTALMASKGGDSMYCLIGQKLCECNTSDFDIVKVLAFLVNKSRKIKRKFNNSNAYTNRRFGEIYWIS